MPRKVQTDLQGHPLRGGTQQARSIAASVRTAKTKAPAPRPKPDQPEHFPGYPYLLRFSQSDRYGKMELLSVDKTSDGFLIGWARVHIGEEDEHEHSVFLS